MLQVTSHTGGYHKEMTMTGWDSAKFLKKVKIEPYRSASDRVDIASTACRVTYIPTGKTLTMDKYKDLSKNKVRALQALFLQVNE